MSDKTKIEWCDSTWNPVTGCLHGCPYCYAMRIANRFSGYDAAQLHGQAAWVYGNGNLPESPEIVETWDDVQFMRWSKKDQDGGPSEDAKLTRAPYPFGFIPTLHRELLDVPQKWKKPRTVFVCSMADLFGAWVPDSWIEDVFAACEKAPQHRYLFLTKNPARYGELARAGKLPQKDNMWYGITPTKDNLQDAFWGGAWHTFASIEPVLSDWSGGIEHILDTYASWVIIGAETGNRKGKVIPKPEWIIEIVRMCLLKCHCLFMKDSLLPIVGEENMFRQFPWDISTWDTKRETEWLGRYYGED